MSTENFIGHGRKDFVNYATELYPITPAAEDIGLRRLNFSLERNGLVYRSDWTPIGVRDSSVLATILNFPAVARLKSIRQLGPNIKHPYSYDHTAWEHSTEQMILALATLGRLAEEQPRLFHEATCRYRFESIDRRTHLQNILIAAALIAAFHDAESPALRDTMKFALKTKDSVTDENILLARRLMNPRDRKYIPLIEMLVEEGFLTPLFAKELPGLIAKVVLREEDGLLGDLLHGKAREDLSDPSGLSKPLDLDRITYTIQDPIRVLGELVFDRNASESETAHGLENWGLYLHYMVANLKQLTYRWALMKQSGREDLVSFEKRFFSERMRPEFMDLTPNIGLGRDELGVVRIGFRDIPKLYYFLAGSLFGNLRDLYLEPGMIFTEKALEREFTKARKRLIKSLGLESNQNLVEYFIGLTDEEAMVLLEREVPNAFEAIGDSQYEGYYFEGRFLNTTKRKDVLSWALFGSKRRTGKKETRYVYVPVHAHPGTSTCVIEPNGRAFPFWKAVPEVAEDLQQEVEANLRGNTLLIHAYDNRGNPFILTEDDVRSGNSQLLL